MTARDSGFELRFSEADRLVDAVSQSLQALERLDLRDPDRNRLAVLIEELLANLFDHGNSPTMVLRARRQDGFVLLVVEDSGPPFDPRAASLDQDIPDRGGGAGLALIRAWADHLDYYAGPPLNRFEIRYSLTS